MRSIAVANQSKTPLGSGLDKLIAVAQSWHDRYFSKYWGTTCTLHAVDAVPTNSWAIILLDDADQADVLGYHDMSPSGQPYSRVFVKTLLENGETVATTFTHELAEMLVDPYCTTMKIDPRNGDVYPYETADAVEGDTFPLDGLKVTDFVTPAWFNWLNKPNALRYDFLGLLIEPFEIRPTGYSSVLRAGSWYDLFGSQQKADAFAREDRRGHRSEYRRRVSSKVVTCLR